MIDKAAVRIGPHRTQHSRHGVAPKRFGCVKERPAGPPAVKVLGQFQSSSIAPVRVGIEAAFENNAQAGRDRVPSAGFRLTEHRLHAVERATAFPLAMNFREPRSTPGAALAGPATGAGGRPVSASTKTTPIA